MNILLTGGAGFIGSHTAVELLNAAMTLLWWIISTTAVRRLLIA